MVSLLSFESNTGLAIYSHLIAERLPPPEMKRTELICVKSRTVPCASMTANDLVLLALNFQRRTF